jgi:hypothetical protein
VGIRGDDRKKILLGNLDRRILYAIEQEQARGGAVAEHQVRIERPASGG